MKTLSHVIEYLIFKIFAWFLMLLPLPWVQGLGRAFGRFTFRVIGYRKGVTLENLTRALPEYPRSELVKVACRAYESIGVTLFELIWAPRMDQDSIRKLVHFENVQEVRKVLERGKGLILATAHFGNWEMCGQSIVSELGVPLNVVVKPLANVSIDSEINLRRGRFGNRPVPMAQAAREITRALQAGEPVGIVGDQSAAKESLWVEFFGRKVPTHPGTAVFALKNRAPLMVGFTVRREDGTYALRFEEVPVDDLPDNTPRNVEELTRRHVRLTEEAIRKHPDQYMWMHRRWKHVPVDDPESGIG